MFSKDTFEEHWEEKFYVLSNIGLIGMEKPDSDLIHYFPFNEFNVTQVKDSKEYKRKFCLTIVPVINGKELKEYTQVLQAPNEENVIKWV